MASLFTKIINRELPAHILAEDDNYLAFLDIRPINTGHSLVIPKLEVDRFFDLPDDILSNMMPFSKKISQALEAVIPCNRVGVIVAGLEVPHAHLHLIPFDGIEELSFSYAKPASDDTLAKLAVKIKKEINMSCS